VFFTTSAYRQKDGQQDRQHGVSVPVLLLRPTADTRLLVSAAAATAEQQFRAGFNYAKAGVMLLGLQPASQVQAELDLFGQAELGQPSQPPDRPALMAAMDALNKRFGRDTVRIGSATMASSGADLRVWATRQDRRSPRFATRWDEMPVVQA